MDRLTRKELKTDKFAAEVGHTVEFLEEHRRNAVIIGAAAIVVLAAVIGISYYLKTKRVERQVALREATRIYQAQIGPQQNPLMVFFPTETAKNEAVQKAFNDIIQKYSGSDEAAIATFYLGTAAADAGKFDEAIKHFQKVMDSADDDYASQAALSLAWVYAGQGKNDDAEKILRKLMDKPTTFVSKEQATIALAKLIGPKKPDEARKLLEPLRSQRGAVSRAAISVLSEVSPPDKK